MAMSRHAISQRCACRLVGVDPKTVRRERPPDSPKIRRRMREIAGERRRFGYRRIGLMLGHEVITMNHKKLRRLYKEEGLAVKRRHGRKRATWRYDYNTVRPHSALNGVTPTDTRRPLEQVEGSAPGALANLSTIRYAETGLTL